MSLRPPHVPCPDVRFDRRQTVDQSRVLIVDADDSRSADIAVLVHRVRRLETRIAGSASVALAIAADFLPGFVLITMDLPDLTGYRLAELLHQQPGLFEARLIALTHEIAAADRQVALSAGFEQYLTIPLEQSALDRVLTGSSYRGVARPEKG